MDDVRRLRRASLMVLVAQIVVFLITLVPLMTRDVNATDSNLNVGTLQAKAVVITNAQDEPAIVLGLAGDAPVLNMKAPDGTGGLSLQARASGHSSVSASGQGAQVTLEVQDGQPAILGFSDKKKRIALEVGADGAELTLDGKKN